MTFSVNEFSVSIEADGPDRLQWSKVTIFLTDDETGYVHGVSTSVLIPEDPSVAIGAVKQRALDRAKTILQAALGHMNAHTATELKEMDWARRDAEFAPIGAAAPEDPL